MSNTHDLLAELVSIEPALARLRDENIAEYGELLSHVLFGDVTRWIVAHAPATHVLDVLERHLASGDADVDNLIAVSFLENLEPGDTAVRHALGPRLSAQLAAMESWTPADLDSPTQFALGGDKHSPKGGSVTSITERVRRFPRCRACRLPGGVDRRLIAGPGVYICEPCIALLARRESAGDTVERCSFCGRRDVPIAGLWPSLAICAPCVELSHSILAEDDRRSRPAT